MSDLIYDTSSMLSKILEQETVDWQAFDAALQGLEDINVIDEKSDETILSEVLLDTDYSHNKEIVVKINTGR